MAANGQLVFTDVDKVTFKGVGNTSNAVIDTITGKLGVGVDSPDANLHIIGNCFVSTNLDLGGDLTTSNIVTGGTLSMGGHILPTANEQYDIGSASYKVRHLFLSDNSLWLGDESKLSFTGNQLKFRRRKKGVTPAAILALDGASQAEALSVRGKGLVTEMKIEDWLAYARTKDPSMDISNIFRDDDADYETTSASEAFKEVGDGIYSTNNVSIGKTTAPTSALDVNGTVTATAFVGTLDAAKITSGTLDTARIPTLNQSTTGSAGSAATLTTPRSIGGVNFNGSADIVPTTFGGATFSGDVAFDTDTLFVDVSANRIGIGTISPLETCDIHGVSRISAAYPKLDFYTTTRTGSDTWGNSTNAAGDYRIYANGDASDGTKRSLNFDYGQNSVHTSRMVINAAGNVGIGASNPQTNLHIQSSGNTGLDIYGGGSSNPYIFIGEYVSNYSRKWGMKMNYYGNSNVEWFNMAVVDDNTEINALTIRRNANIGIGTQSPEAKLELNQGTRPSASSATHGMRWSNTDNANHWHLFNSNNDHFRFVFNGVAKGYVDPNDANAQMNFTGQHRTFIKDIPFTRAIELEGLIVSADNNKYIKMSGGIEVGSNAITTNESLPIVSLSATANDKKCFGVISASEDPENRTEQYGAFGTNFDKEKGDTRVYINSVGEGAIWVTNINGSLESGDYITTSNVTGYGQRQDSEFLANYTVAKITMDCDFEPVTQPIQQIKKELQDVNYWIKTTYENITEEEYSNLTEENRRTVDDIYQRIIKEGTKTEKEGYELEVRQELVNVLDEHGQIQWEDDPSGATEKAYKIRYLDASGVRTDEANAVHTAAFVGCTYHCG